MSLNSSTLSSAPRRNYGLRGSRVNNTHTRKFRHRVSANIQGCTLMKVPVELRRMIFDLALPDEFDGTTPEFLRGFRQFGMLYDEALSAFHNKNYTFVLNKTNNWSFDHLDPKVLATIKTVKLTVTEDIWIVNQMDWISGQLDYPNPSAFCLTDLEKNCATAKDVASVILECHPSGEALWHSFHWLFPHYLSGFSRLTKVTMSVPPNVDRTGALVHIALDDRDIFPDIHEEEIKKGLKSLDNIFGVKHKMIKSLPDNLDKNGKMLAIKYRDRCRWVWEADVEKGEALVLARR